MNAAVSNKPLLSISIPVLNEEGNILNLYDRLCALAMKMQDKCEFEFVFSDNHSTDQTWPMLEGLAGRDKRVKAIRFSRNFGFQRSILANYLHTTGDAVVQIDADLQDPPEMIEQFFDDWQAGYQVVYGVRTMRSESKFSAFCRRAGYWLINILSDHEIPRDAGDFRLIDRKIVEVLRRTNSHSPYLRGSIAGMGFNQKGLEYQRDARASGHSKFNLPRLIGLGLVAIYEHSTIPLRMATYLGLFILLLSVLGAAYYLSLKMIFPNLPQGLASIHIIVLFSIGMNAFLLGVIGEYILRIYVIVRSDPLIIVEDSINLEDVAPVL